MKSVLLLFLIIFSYHTSAFAKSGQQFDASVAPYIQRFDLLVAPMTVHLVTEKDKLLKKYNDLKKKQYPIFIDIELWKKNQQAITRQFMEIEKAFKAILNRKNVDPREYNELTEKGEQLKRDFEANNVFLRKKLEAIVSSE